MRCVERKWTRFWIDEKEYSVPDIWLSVQMKARTTMGMDVTEAAVGAMSYWAEQQELGEEFKQ